MAKQTLRYEIVLAHAGRRDDTIIETVEATSKKTYEALATKTYYGIRQAA
jgi:hypothetical protein